MTIVPLAEVTADARRRYGVAARASALPGEVAQNVLLELEPATAGAANERRFVLKIAPPDQIDDDLAFENAILAHLAEATLPFAVPRLIADRAGETIVRVGTSRARARLLAHVDGRTWAATPRRGPALRASLGEALAWLDRALQGLEAPPARRDHPWDLRHTDRHRGDLGAIEDPTRRALAERAFHHFAALVRPHLATLPSSVIHGDANDHNVLVAGEGDEARVAGLIDFGDATFSATVFELAIALAYALHGEADPLAAAEDVVRAYHAVRPLSALELDVLFPAIRARLATSVVTAARRRRARSDNEYLFVSEAPAWDLLALLDAVEPALARARFGRACGEPAPPATSSRDEHLRRRALHIGPNLSVSYREPLEIVRGHGAYLYDRAGRPYLDLVNNVCHVGHCHPHVVGAAQRQIATLNTNTRYLYDGLVDYAERLAATLPAPLEVCYFVTSGSEANELALRLARAYTGRRDVVVLDGAYHGHTGGLIEISPYKFMGRGGSGRAEDHVHVVPVPDGYRGPYKGAAAEVGRRYADHVREVVATSKRPIAAFIGESLLGCGGQIVPPAGYLAEVYRHVRAAGGVAIVDEVQVGFGRVGEAFWGFELQGVVPDIVVLGKPIGNGHPMGAVVTTRAIADAFANGMEFFSTFGGNPVSCAVGMAVLDVIEREGLQARARELGTRLRRGLEALAERHPLIGEVRGRGLFLGVELVRDRATLEPAAEETAAVVERLRHQGILLAVDGPLHNVIKIKPPLVLDEGDVDMTVRCVDRALRELR